MFHHAIDVGIHDQLFVATDIERFDCVHLLLGALQRLDHKSRFPSFNYDCAIFLHAKLSYHEYTTHCNESVPTTTNTPTGPRMTPIARGTITATDTSTPTTTSTLADGRTSTSASTPSALHLTLTEILTLAHLI